MQYKQRHLVSVACVSLRFRVSSRGEQVLRPMKQVRQGTRTRARDAQPPSLHHLALGFFHLHYVSCVIAQEKNQSLCSLSEIISSFLQTFHLSISNTLPPEKSSCLEEGSE